MSPASAVVLGTAMLALVLAWGYFRRYAISRPPLGVLSIGDVVALMAGVLLMPYLYLAIPTGVAAAILGVGLVNLLATAAQPVLPVGWLGWLAALGLVGADAAATVVFGPRSPAYFAVNNVVLVLA